MDLTSLQEMFLMEGSKSKDWLTELISHPAMDCKSNKAKRLQIFRTIYEQLKTAYIVRSGTVVYMTVLLDVIRSYFPSESAEKDMGAPTLTLRDIAKCPKKKEAKKRNNDKL